MAGLIFFGVIGGWLALCLKLARWLTEKYLGPNPKSIWTALAFAGIAAAPFADEIVGVQFFDRLCGSTPLDQVYGTAAFGPGAFFDAQGREIWRDDKRYDRSFNRLSDLDPYKSEFDKHIKFESRSMWPEGFFDFTRRDFLYIDKSTGQVLYRTTSFFYPGGWVRNHVPMLGAYSCHPARQVAFQLNGIMRFAGEPR